jgi:hypothetical protein
MSDDPVFAPEFAITDIGRLADDYLKRRTDRSKLTFKETDELALDAGARIRRGEHTKANLRIIVEWKNENSQFWKERKGPKGPEERKALEALFESNSDERVASVLASVLAALDQERPTDAVVALTTLDGVRVRTASAILMAIDPERYTVIDKHALRAFGVHDQEVAFYLLYNNWCRGFAKEQGVCLRTLDRAAWEYGKRQGQRRPRLARRRSSPVNSN